MRGSVHIYSNRPQNKEELFNLRHAQLRNVIECIFGVLKREFKMAAEPCEYPIKIQCLIPLGLSLVHNFLRDHDPDRYRAEAQVSLRDEPSFTPHGDEEPSLGARPQRADEDGRAEERRTRIAEQMWTSYQAVLQSREVE